LEEGLCWREILSFLANRKLDTTAEDERTMAMAGDTAAPSGTEEGDITWTDLLTLLIRERLFFSLHKGANKKFELRRLPTSKRVLECFFEKAREKPIRKSHNS
jgi:hypothetical protein